MNQARGGELRAGRHAPRQHVRTYAQIAGAASTNAPIVQKNSLQNIDMKKYIAWEMR